MTTRTLDSDGFAKSTISHGQRKDIINSQRDVLWNVVEPGDSYDIRKSMIASLPGKTKNFMGDNVQLVCLFQAAQIQRLNEYLIEYRQRYLQLQRRQLDRHSYEVQIKQLTERLGAQNLLRNQNYKLQEHIKRLNEENMDLHQRVRSSAGNLGDSANYQSALSKIESLIQQNNSLSYQNKGLQSDNSRLKYELETLDRLRSQERNGYLAEQNARISSTISNQTQSIRSKYQNEIYRLEKQNQRFSQSIQLKNHEISDLTERLAYLEQEVGRLQNHDAIMNEYEDKVALMAGEIDRLNQILKDKKINEDNLLQDRNSFSFNLSKIQDENRKLIEQNEKIRNTLNYVDNERRRTSLDQSTMDQLHQKLIDSGNQIDRLNRFIQENKNQQNSLRNDYNQLILQMNRLPILENQNNDLKRRLGDADSYHRNVAEYQNKIALLSSEIQRLSYTGDKQRGLEEENKRLRQQNARLRIDINQIQDSLNRKYLNDNQILRRDYENRIRDIESNTSNRYINEINQTKNKYSILVNKLSQDVDPDAGKKVGMLSEEVDRLNQVIANAKEDNNRLLLRNAQLERIIPEIRQKDMLLQGYQAKINDLDARLRDLLGEKVNVETRMRSISDQNEDYKRTHDYTLRDRDSLRRENDELRKQLGLLGDFQNKSRDYENQIIGLTKENERLRDLFNQVDGLNKQIERLRKQNACLINDLREAENRLRSEYDNRIREVEGSTTQKYITEITHITNNYEEKLNRLSQDIDPDGEKKIQYLLEQLDRLNDVLDRLKRQRNDLILENQDLRANASKINEKDSLIQALQVRLQDLENQLRSIQGQNLEVHTKIRSISEQNDHFKRNKDYTDRELNNLRRQNGDYLRKITQITQYQMQIKDYETQIQILRRQLDSVKLLLGELNKLRTENDELHRELENSRSQENIIKHLNTRIRDLQNRLREIEGESTQVNMRVRSLSEQNENFKRVQDFTNRDMNSIRKQNQGLRNKLNEALHELDNAKDATASVDYLRSQNKKYTQQISELTIKINELHSKIQELRILQRQSNFDKQKIKQLQKILADTESSLQRSNNQLRNKQGLLLTSQINQKRQEQVLQKLTDQLDRLTNILNKHINENNQKTRKVDSLSSQNQHYKSSHTNLQRDRDYLRKEKDDLMRKIDELRNKLMKAQQKIDLLNKQLDRLEQNVGQKESIIKSKDIHLQEKTNIIESLRREISESINTRSDIQIQLRDYENKYRTSESSHEVSKHQIQVLRRQIQQLSDDINHLRDQLSQYNDIKQQRQRLRYQVQKKDDQHNREKEQWNSTYQHLQKNNKYLDKKKRINDINDQDSKRRFQFLQSQAQRLKKEKDLLYTKDINQLRSEIEKLINERQQLRRFNTQLALELDQKNKNQTQQIQRIIQQRDDALKELNRLKYDSSHNKIDKPKIKALIKQINQDAQNRNSFYEDEIKRAKSDKDRNIGLYTTKIQNLMVEFNIQKSKNISDAQKIKQYEQMIDRLNKNLSDLYSQISARTAQIEDLKYKLSNLERENDNNNTKVRSLEQSLGQLGGQNVQLRQKTTMVAILQEKITTYTQKIQQLQKKIDILNDKNRQLLQEGDAKGRKYRQLVAQLRDYELTLENLVRQHRELEALLNRYRDENGNLMDTASKYEKVKGDLNRFQYQNKSLNDHVKMVNQLLQKTKAEKDDIIRNTSDQETKISERYYNQYTQRIEEYERKISELNRNNSDLQSQILRLKNNQYLISDLQQKIEILTRELQKISDDLSESINKQNKLQYSNTELKRSADQYYSTITQLENDKLNMTSELDRKAQQAETCIEKFTEENRELRQRLEKDRQILSKIPEYERKIKQLTAIVDELTERVSYSNKTSSTINNKYTSLQDQNRRLKLSVDNLKKQLQDIEDSYQVTINKLKNENQDLRRYSKQIPELNIKMQSLESKKLQASSEVEQLRRLLQSKDNEILRIKQQNNGKVSYYESDKISQTDRYRKLQSQYNSLLREYQNLKRRTNQSDTGVQKLYEEFNRLQQIIEKLKKERASIIDKNLNLGREYDRLLAVNRKLEDDVKELRLEVADKISIQNRLKEQLALMVVLFAQIESLRSRIENVENQNQGLRRDSLTPYRL